MRPLVAMVACQNPKYAGLQQACRDTWMAEWRDLVDIRVFIGNPPGPELDRTVYLDCPDEYLALPLKTWSMVTWAKANGYTNVFKCDDDSYIHVPRLLASGWEKQDYTGRHASAHTFVFGQGGAGYWLSSRAMDVVVAAPRDYWAQRQHKCLHMSCEDMAVGLLLKNNGIQLQPDSRYFHGMGMALVAGQRVTGLRSGPTNKFITAHKCTVKDLYEIHTSFVR